MDALPAIPEKNHGNLGSAVFYPSLSSITRSYMVNVLFFGSLFFPFCCENSTHPCDCWPGCSAAATNCMKFVLTHKMVND